MNSRLACSSSQTGPPSNVYKTERQKQLRALYSKFHLKCRECHCPLPLKVQDLIDKWLATAKTFQISAVHCPECHRITCVGCGHLPSLDKDNVLKTPGLLSNCCHVGRIFGIWMLLSAFDERERQPSKESLTKPTTKPYSGMKKFSGVGYAPASGESYDLSYVATHNGSRKSGIDAEKEPLDNFMTRTLKLLTACLPEYSSDLNSASTGLEELLLLRISCLFDRVIALIRNDSITEMTERHDLYDAVFSFLEAILANPPLRELLFEQRQSKRASPVQFLGPVSYRLIDSPYDFSPSLFTSCNPSYKQVKAFLELVEKPGGASEQSHAGEKKVSVRICKRLVQLYESMKRSHVINAAADAEEEREDPWALYMEDNKVTFTDEVLKNHRFYNQNATPNSSSAHGRMIAIGKEIANMTTSLPPGIFLKVAESRSDFMKVLIVGAEGSPYANGLFIFDLFLDANYPTTPPQMKFVLNIDESMDIPMNPNLHIGGTVCLSILNTWHGDENQRWQPNKSTILSVLISIQAMILGTPLPWLNEPGREHRGACLEARNHNLVLQCMTVRHAIIAWLQKNLHASQIIWKDVSDMYWKHNSEKVFQLVKDWATDNPKLARGNPKAPARSKTKSKAGLGSGENLVEILRGLFGPLLTSVPETGAEVSTGKGSRKRRASGSSMTPKRQKAGGSKKGKNNPTQENKELTWFFTGSHQLRVIREACSEFGVAPARSIKDCIDRLEKFVNEKGKANKDLMDKWGIMDYEEEEEEDCYLV